MIDAAMQVALLFAAAAFFAGWLLGYATRAYISRRRRIRARRSILSF